MDYLASSAGVIIPRRWSMPPDFDGLTVLKFALSDRLISSVEVGFEAARL